MEELQRAYSRLCKESGAEPQEAVLQRLHGLLRGRLDLATQSLTLDTCRALGKLLQKEALLTELVLSDCMLSDEGGHRRTAVATAALAASEGGQGSASLGLFALLLSTPRPWCSVARLSSSLGVLPFTVVKASSSIHSGNWGASLCSEKTLAPPASWLRRVRMGGGGSAAGLCTCRVSNLTQEWGD